MMQKPVKLALICDVAVLLTLVPAGVDAEDDSVGISLKSFKPCTLRLF
jgi:hypothetical protein